MFLACSTLPFRKRPLREALEKMAALGVKRVELCVEPSHSEPIQWEQTPEKILRLVKRLGISVNSIHVPLPDESPNVPLPEIRNLSTQLTQKTIDLAAFFNAKFVVQHVRIMFAARELGPTDSYENTSPDLDAVSSYAAAQGIKVALENVPSSVKRMAGSSTEELIDLTNHFPVETVGICLDVTHCIASGFSPLAALDAIDFKRLISIHASDNFSDQLIDQHLPIGAGNLPWKSLIGELKSQKYQGAFVVEVAGGSDEVKTLTDSLNQLQNFGLHV